MYSIAYSAIIIFRVILTDKKMRCAFLICSQGRVCSFKKYVIKDVLFNISLPQYCYCYGRRYDSRAKCLIFCLPLFYETRRIPNFVPIV